MALALQFDIRGLDASPARIASLERSLAPERVSAVAGRAGVNRGRKHLLALNRERPNALGGRRTNFYQKAANSISVRSEGDGVMLSFASVGLAQRYFGGTITAKNAKYLTIPARTEAYGKRASEFPDLELVFLENGPALIRRNQSTIKFRKSKEGNRRAVKTGELGGEVMFWLKRSVTQRADPSVLPTDTEFYDEIEKSVRDYAQLQIDRASGGATS